MKRLFALPLLALTLPAQAELPPCVTDDLMREASIVVQITDQSVSRYPNNLCSLSGTIAVVHRGAVTPGQNLTAIIDCLTDPDAVAIGAITYNDPDAIARAGAVELHIGTDGFVAADSAGVLTLSAPTQTIAWEPFCS